MVVGVVGVWARFGWAFCTTMTLGLAPVGVAMRLPVRTVAPPAPRTVVNCRVLGFTVTTLAVVPRVVPAINRPPAVEKFNTFPAGPPD